MLRRWWGLFRQAPKFVFVALIIVGSTAIFAIWLFTRSLYKPHPISDQDEAAIAKKAAQAEARVDYLFLADDDLYDAGTGECLFKNWLHGDHPARLFYDQNAKKIIGEYPQGFARYGFNGRREAAMMMPLSPPAMIPGGKQVVFAKEKNIWIADIDWQKFEFTNQRQVTTMGVFYEQNFATNVQLLTDKTLVLRNLNNLLRVNLENGDVHPLRLPLNEITKRRSPDSRWVAGFMNGQFYCYDVDADATKTIPVGRNGMSDFQWIGSDKCVGLAARQEIIVYDRLAHTLTEITQLPFASFKIGEPSPDGRFIFATGGIDGTNGALVDLQDKTVERVVGGVGVLWVSDDTFEFSRDLLDSNLRGTWLQKAKENGKRISNEPCLVKYNHALVAILDRSFIALFVTFHGIEVINLKSWEIIHMLNFLNGNSIVVINQINQASRIQPLTFERLDSKNPNPILPIRYETSAGNF